MDVMMNKRLILIFFSFFNLQALRSQTVLWASLQSWLPTGFLHHQVPSTPQAREDFVKSLRTGRNMVAARRPEPAETGCF